MKLILLKIFILFVGNSIATSFDESPPDVWEEPAKKIDNSYRCTVDKECLNHLKNNLLDKDNSESIYNICEKRLNIYKNCCANPTSCNDSYAETFVQSVEKDSLGLVQQSGGSCQSNNLSKLSSFLFNTQSNLCELGIENCETDCNQELLNFKTNFKKCFNIRFPHTIDSVLKESQKTTSNSDCWKEMKEVSKKYKEQSLDKVSLFKKDIEPKDIVQCKEIEKSKTTQGLNRLSFQICERAKSEQQVENQRVEETQKAEEAKRAKEAQKVLEKAQQKFEERKRKFKEQQQAATRQAETNIPAQIANLAENQNPKSASSKKSSSSSALLGAGALAGAGVLGTKALLDKPSKSSQKPDKNLKESSKSSTQSKTSTSTGNVAGNTNNLKLAQSSNSQKCPINVPKIESVVVYQSVEAPQIEPMNQQPALPYNNYDLVQGKPAGVLIKLDRKGMDKNELFIVGLKIPGINNFQNRCFHEPFNGQMEISQINRCLFNNRSLRKEGKFKFIPLPMRENILNNGEMNLNIIVTLLPINYDKNTSCFIQKSFRVKIIKTPDLKLGFTRIYGGKRCTSYGYSSLQIVTDFAGSKEVKRYIPSMFPINKVTTKVINYISGSCDNNRYHKRSGQTIGILRDIDILEKHRQAHKLDKFVAIVPENYFLFHNKVDKKRRAVAGFVIQPYWEYWRYFIFQDWRYKSGFLGGSWNITFISDDQKNQGTIAHELAHTLGQEKEQYDQKQHTELCQEFRGQTPILCHNQQIARGLDSWNNGSSFNFVKNKWSIMNNRGGILDQWIDRDTFQKIFSALLRFGAVISNTTELFGRSIVRNNKIVITGFYDQTKDKIILPKQEILKTDLTTPSFSVGQHKNIPNLIIKLDRHGDDFETIERPAFKMRIRTIYKDRTEKTEVLPISLITAAFELPKETKDTKIKDLSIRILNSNRRILYKAPLIKRKSNAKKNR